MGASYTADSFIINIDRLRYGKDGLQPYANFDVKPNKTKSDEKI